MTYEELVARIADLEMYHDYMVSGFAHPDELVHISNMEQRAVESALSDLYEEKAKRDKDALGGT